MAKHTHAEIACTEAIFGGLASAVLAPFGYGQQNPPQQCPQDQVCPGINQGSIPNCCDIAFAVRSFRSAEPNLNI